MKYILKVVCVMLVLLINIVNGQEKGKPRVYITDSETWQISGGFSVTGGARPQTAEIIKTFGEKCEECTVTIKKENADYIVILEHEEGKNYLRKDNKVAVFNKDGDAIESSSTRILGNAVKNACDAIKKDWGISVSKK